MVEVDRTETLYHPDISSIIGLTKEAIFSIFGKDRFNFLFRLGRLRKQFDSIIDHALGLDEEIKRLTNDKNNTLLPLREMELDYFSALSTVIEWKYPFFRVYKQQEGTDSMEDPEQQKELEEIRKELKKEENQTIENLLVFRDKLIQESRRLGIANYWAKVE